MITKLAIKNLRGLKDVALDHLRRVNLLVGGNDTGKTSVLEAITLLLGDGSALRSLPVSFRSNQQQGAATSNSRDDFENFGSWLFNDGNVGNRILLTGTTNDGRQVVLRSEAARHRTGILFRSLPPKGGDEILATIREESTTIPERAAPEGLNISRLSIRPSNPVEDAERYNQVALNADGEKRIEQVMREINPNVHRLRYAKLPGTSSPLVFVDIGLSRAIPATQMGQAFNRLLHIYTEILSARANVLLVDEIENGIFTANLLPIWKGLLAVCEQEDVQVFATTHSLECVRAALATSKERGKDEL